MDKMGLEVVSFTIKEVRDKNEYITNMGKPDVARIKRDADVAAAEASRLMRATSSARLRRKRIKSALKPRRCRWPNRPKRSGSWISRRLHISRP